MAVKETVAIIVDDLDLRIPMGLYDAELKVENHFRVSAALYYDKSRLPEGSFLNYEQVAGILKTRMHSGERLLEAVASACISDFTKTWPYIYKVRVCIKKCNPAFAGLHIDAVGVDITLEI